MSAAFSVGDHVYATLNPRPESVHWKITSLHQATPGVTYATLQSPMSGRSRVVPTGNLTLHTLGSKTKGAGA